MAKSYLPQAACIACCSLAATQTKETKPNSFYFLPCGVMRTEGPRFRSSGSGLVSDMNWGKTCPNVERTFFRVAGSLIFTQPETILPFSIVREYVFYSSEVYSLLCIDSYFRSRSVCQLEWVKRMTPISRFAPLR